MADEKEVSSTTSHSKLKDIGWGYRHQQCFILFIMYIIAYSMKSCIGMALVVMTKNNKSNMTGFQGENASIEFKPEGILNTLMLVPPYPTFHWDKTVQETVVASFFWGYMLLQLPAGQIAHRFGVRYLLTSTMTINFVVAIIFPMASYYGNWYCTVACRFVQGLSQGCLLPGTHTFLGKWTPLHERGRLSTFVYGGQAFGIVLGLSLTGLISSSAMGWPGIFRLNAMLSGILALIVWFLLYDTPEKHPKISFLERKYIEDDVGTKVKKILPVPWMKIIRHRGIHAATIAQAATGWANLVLYSEVPVYMDKIMKVNIKANGLLTALPFMVMWCTGFFFSWLTDHLIVKNIFSVTNTRKVSSSLAYIPAGFGMIALAYVPSNIYIVETLLVTIGAFKIAAYGGFVVNHIDITPNFAGSTMSFSNFQSNIVTSLSPLVIGFILTDVEDKYLWRKVFWLAAGMYFVTDLIYVLFATSERAEWNEPHTNEEEKDVEESLPIMKKSEQ